MKVLGIETSCDETGIALYDSETGRMTQSVYSQIEIHAAFGGVVPELASRDHVRKIIPLIQEVLAKAGLQMSNVDAIAYTAGPGLIGAVLVGASVARSLGWALNVPTIQIHHMEGHLMAPLLAQEKPIFPFLALLVSGGHTLLVRVERLGCYLILGETLDDAAGEAFDKIAKLIGLPYPGGPLLAALASTGNPHRFHFPRPMLDRPGLDFSFSGLKTFAANVYKKEVHDDQTKADVAYALQEAIVDTLAAKCHRALKQTGLTDLVVAGGVSANQRLREKLRAQAKSLNGRCFFPPLELCTDNGAMIAYAGYLRLSQGLKDQDLSIHARARWNITELDSPF